MRLRIILTTILAAAVCVPAALADDGSPGDGKRSAPTEQQAAAFCARLQEQAAAWRAEFDRKLREVAERIQSLPPDQRAVAEERFREEVAKAKERFEAELQRVAEKCKEAERAREMREKKANHGQRVRKCAHDKQDGDRNHGERVRECAHDKGDRAKERAKERRDQLKERAKERRGAPKGSSVPG